MSAESKRARGESGKKNAEHSPFRLNGRNADWEIKARGVYHTPSARSSGRRTLMGLMGGVLAEALGYGPWHGSEAKYDQMIEDAEKRTKT